MGSVGDLMTQEELPCPLLEERFSVLKQSIIAPENKERVIESYERLTAALAVEADRIAKLGPASIPEIDFADLEANGGVLPEGLEATVRHTGCLIIRGVVDEETASGWENTLRTYTKSHPNIGGFPVHDPQNFSLFWTKPQVEMRSHANVLKATNAISKLWHVSDDSIPFDLSAQVAYADRFRIRHPSKVENYTLKAHQDSGAIERWEDPLYRACYQAIFDGAWEDYDAFSADFRSEAKTCLYSDKSCTAFRSFQGWISLSHTGTGEGTLRLLPELKMSTAYNLLRPYFILGEKFDDTTPVFPGATPGHIQFRPTPELHPHLFLEKMTVGIPPVKPGDYVFWHCDLVHEVDRLHPGQRDSSVSYNPCVPLCLYNLDSLVALRESFLSALPPRDFIKYEHGEYECKHADHGAHKENILTDEGLRAMGFLPFDTEEEGLSSGQKAIRKLANEKLGFASVAA
ncbi:hypothetical protein SBRCBS47491_008245 [Sporothrix bragantina]|uniref:DUF1479 domain protein n=1 Tax=Sporothrix bragantina TaxID=671064 RepID=A0ABP0CLU7_9PEZI